jgi:hypothetical protein
MRNPGRPAWQVDVAWAAALLAWLTALVATVMGVLAVAASPRVGPDLQAWVLDTAFAAEGPAPALAGPTVAVYDGRGPFELWPGTGVTVTAAELPTLSLGEARARLATDFAERRLQEGAAWTGGLRDEDLIVELDALERAVLAPLAEAELRRVMLPLGLDDGTRAADWPTQAARNPGQPVQPLVGVFVTMPVDQVQGAGVRLVGQRVVAGLAERLAEGGVAAARAAMGNAQLLAALEAALEGPVRQAWRAALAAAWVPRDAALAQRLEDAQAVLVETEQAVDPLASAGWSGVDLTDATPEEARTRTLAALAERSYEGGSVAVVAVLASADARGRVEAAAPWLDAVSADARRGYLVAAWVAAVVTVLLLVILALVQQGWARAFVPGGVLLLAAALPLAAWWWWRGAAEAPVGVEAPAGVAALGLPGAARAWAEHLTASSAAVAAEAVAWPIWVTAGAGAGLVLLAALAGLFGLLRPRRRRY